MNCFVFLEYFNYNDNKFNVNEFYNDSNSYIEALNKYASIDSAELMKTNEKMENFETQYAKCECILYDSENKPMTVDKFVGYYNSNEMAMFIIELKLDTEDEEFDSELNGWYQEHLNIDKKAPWLNGNDRFNIEPKRDVKVIFNNNANKETYCTLCNTSIIEKIDNEHYVIIVDKVIFTKNF